MKKKTGNKIECDNVKAYVSVTLRYAEPSALAPLQPDKTNTEYKMTTECAPLVGTLLEEHKCSEKYLGLSLTSLF